MRSLASTGVTALLVMAVLFAAACGRESPVKLGAASDPDLQDRASEYCGEGGLKEAQRYGADADGLAAAHPTTGADLRDWEVSLTGVSPEQSKLPMRAGPDEFVALCYFDGVSAPFPGPPPDEESQSPSPYSRIMVMVREDGTPEFMAAGRPETMPSDDRPSAER